MLEKEAFLAMYQENFGNHELSVATFCLPIKNESILGFYKPGYSPEHGGVFATAVDISIPDPRTTDTVIYAPCDGVIYSGVFRHDKWGEGVECKKYLNWVNIALPSGEFCELAHIRFHPKRILRVGDVIRRGEPIAMVGLNGRVTMTEMEPDVHLHMYVGKWTGVGMFEGRRINWDLG